MERSNRINLLGIWRYCDRFVPLYETLRERNDRGVYGGAIAFGFVQGDRVYQTIVTKPDAVIFWSHVNKPTLSP
jgi:hypothetical protein